MHHSIYLLTKIYDVTITIAQFASDGTTTIVTQVGNSVKMFFFHVIGIDFVVITSFGLAITIAQASF